MSMVGLIAARRQSVIIELRKALSRSQRNHHKQALAHRNAIATTHTGAHWQHCDSPSCVIVKHQMHLSFQRNAGR